jgi:hypothetical protein
MVMGLAPPRAGRVMKKHFLLFVNLTPALASFVIEIRLEVVMAEKRVFLKLILTPPIPVLSVPVWVA